MSARRHDVTVVNPSGSMTCQPLLPEVAAGTEHPLAIEPEELGTVEVRGTVVGGEQATR